MAGDVAEHRDAGCEEVFTEGRLNELVLGKDRNVGAGGVLCHELVAPGAIAGPAVVITGHRVHIAPDVQCVTSIEPVALDEFELGLDVGAHTDEGEAAVGQLARPFVALGFGRRRDRGDVSCVRLLDGPVAVAEREASTDDPMPGGQVGAAERVAGVGSADVAAEWALAAGAVIVFVPEPVLGGPRRRFEAEIAAERFRRLERARGLDRVPRHNRRRRSRAARSPGTAR